MQLYEKASGALRAELEYRQRAVEQLKEKLHGRFEEEEIVDEPDENDPDYLNRLYPQNLEEEIVKIWMEEYADRSAFEVKPPPAVVSAEEKEKKKRKKRLMWDPFKLAKIREFEKPDNLCCFDGCPKAPVHESLCHDHQGELPQVKKVRMQRQHARENPRRSSLLGFIYLEMLLEKAAEDPAEGLAVWRNQLHELETSANSCMDCATAKLEALFASAKISEMNSTAAAASSSPADDVKCPKCAAAAAAAATSSSNTTSNVVPPLLRVPSENKEAQLMKAEEQELATQIMNKARKSELHPTKRNSIYSMLDQIAGDGTSLPATPNLGDRALQTPAEGRRSSIFGTLQSPQEGRRSSVFGALQSPQEGRRASIMSPGGGLLQLLAQQLQMEEEKEKEKEKERKESVVHRGRRVSLFGVKDLLSTTEAIVSSAQAQLTPRTPATIVTPRIVSSTTSTTTTTTSSTTSTSTSTSTVTSTSTSTSTSTTTSAEPLLQFFEPKAKTKIISRKADHTHTTHISDSEREEEGAARRHRSVPRGRSRSKSRERNKTSPKTKEDKNPADASNATKASSSSASATTAAATGTSGPKKVRHLKIRAKSHKPAPRADSGLQPQPQPPSGTS